MGLKVYVKFGVIDSTTHSIRSYLKDYDGFFNLAINCADEVSDDDDSLIA